MDRPRKLVERLQQLENLAKLLLCHLLVILQAAQAHVLRADVEQHLGHLHIVIDVLDPLFAGDLVERRLGDVHIALLQQFRHLPV